MKKLLLCVAVLLMAVVAQAQKIELDEINSLNKRIILTSLEKVNWNSSDYQAEVGMMLDGSERSILLNWQCHEIVGAERDSKIVLMLDDDSQVILYNKAFSVAGSGKITSENVSATTMGIKIDARGDFEALKDKYIKSIHIETTSGEIVFPVSNEEAISLKKLYEVFDKQCSKKIKREEY